LLLQFETGSCTSKLSRILYKIFEQNLEFHISHSRITSRDRVAQNFGRRPAHHHPKSSTGQLVHHSTSNRS
ncbi:MAG: hypothetical protein ACK53Y_19480, partial [bacterium]